MNMVERSMPYDLATLGNLVADIVVPIVKLPLMPNEHSWAEGLFLELGGSGTSLVAARRMGLSAVALEVMGADEYGQQVKRMLADEGVDVSRLWLDPTRRTEMSIVVTDRAGQHLFLGVQDAMPPPPILPEWREAIIESRSLLLTGYTLRDILTTADAVEVLAAAQEAGVAIFFDLGPNFATIEPSALAATLRATTVLLLTLEEAQFLVSEEEPAEAARALHKFGPQVVVLKAGAEGCYVSAEGEVIHQSGYQVEVVDTVGAGDSFVSAFIAGYLRGGSWWECAAVANAMGAAMAATQGAGRRVPGAARLLELLGDDPAAHLVRG